MPADVLQSPRCLPEELGLSIPDDDHAVSVCLPTWADIVGYEEKDERVIGQLQAAYPRFGFHPVIKKLCAEQLDRNGLMGLPFPTQAVANRAVRYCQERANIKAKIVSFPNGEGGLPGVCVPEADFATLKEYWQHAGENLSSRAISTLQSGAEVTFTESAARRTVRDRFADLQQTDSANVSLYPSGMASIAAAFRAVQSVRPGRTCQFGFPYVDTLKVQQKFAPSECLFLPVGGSEDLDKLEHACQQDQNITAVFCEVPTNPLLITPDLKRLSKLARQYDFLLVVDDTLTACGNIQTLPYSDLTVTSLTKYFSGGGNLLAGALTVNPEGRYADRLKQVIGSEFEETLSDDDVVVLESNSRDVRERMQITNSNAACLADYLRQHAAVDQVHYPSAEDQVYCELMQGTRQFGGLMSIVLHDAERNTPGVYDSLRINKGPNLGTRFTLCCPFTMLAHYQELDFAESCGVSRWLLRISVGLEDADELIQRFDDALATAK